MLIPLLAAALALQAAPPAALPGPVVTLEQLTGEQAAAARCAIVFAAVSRWQRVGDARGAAYPDMAASGGREFFVQVMAKLMDDARLTRENVIALASAGVEDHDRPGGAERIAALMPSCLAMKAAAGL